MFNTFMKWRVDNDVDNILEVQLFSLSFLKQTFKYDEIDAVQAVYPHFYHKIDKKGRPIYIERLGLLKIDELFKLTTEERLVKHYIISYETLMRLRFPACSAIAGTRIE